METALQERRVAAICRASYFALAPRPGNRFGTRSDTFERGKSRRTYRPQQGTPRQRDNNPLTRVAFVYNGPGMELAPNPGYSGGR